jgi:hypothetical protein
MKGSDVLKAAEEKMNHSLLAYSQGKANSDLHKLLIDDLKKATNEFLELRDHLHRGTNMNVERTKPEEIVFCDCVHSTLDCTAERWKICKRRIQKEAEELKAISVARGNS